MQIVDDWAAAGRLIDTPHGRVWMREVAADRDEGLPPLLVLHGFPTCSFDWREVLPRLCERRRVVLLDFPGFGLSDKPDVRYGIRMYADCAEAVAVAAGVTECALLTHDMGDTVGGELLARELEGALPFRVVERVLSNGSIYIGMAQLTAGQQMLLSLDDAPFDLAEHGIDPGEGYRAGVAATFSPRNPADPEEMAAQWDLVSRQSGHTLLPRTIRYIEDRRAEESRFTGAIERHPSPLGVVWGVDDPVAVVAMTDRLAEATPEARITRLDGVGHYPMIEAPETFANATLALLS
jgi:pimeloyl-ACP methyl ester carboxylesterase